MNCCIEFKRVYIRTRGDKGENENVVDHHRMTRGRFSMLDQLLVLLVQNIAEFVDM